MAVTLRATKGSRLTHAEMDENWKSVMGGHNFLHIQDQKAQGADSGTFTSGAWRTRDLNTVLTNTITGASLAANQITLPAGTYYVEASAPARTGGDTIRSHQARLYDTMGSGSELIIGTTERARMEAISTDASIRSCIFGCFELSESSTIELQHQCLATESTEGFGFAADFATEVYSDIRIWRLGEYEEE